MSLRRNSSNCSNKNNINNKMTTFHKNSKTPLLPKMGRFHFDAVRWPTTSTEGSNHHGDDGDDDNNISASSLEAIVGYNNHMGRIYFNSFQLHGQTFKVGDFYQCSCDENSNKKEVFRIMGAFHATASFVGYWSDAKRQHKDEIQKQGHPYILVTTLKLVDLNKEEQELVVDEGHIDALPIWLGESYITTMKKIHVSLESSKTTNKNVVGTNQDKGTPRTMMYCRRSLVTSSFHEITTTAIKRKRHKKNCDQSKTSPPKYRPLTKSQHSLLSSDPPTLFQCHIPTTWNSSFDAQRVRFVHDDRPQHRDGRLPLYYTQDSSDDDHDDDDDEDSDDDDDNNYDDTPTSDMEDTTTSLTLEDAASVVGNGSTQQQQRRRQQQDNSSNKDSSITPKKGCVSFSLAAADPKDTKVTLDDDERSSQEHIRKPLPEKTENKKTFQSQNNEKTPIMDNRSSTAPKQDCIGISKDRRIHIGKGGETNTNAVDVRKQQQQQQRQQDVSNFVKDQKETIKSQNSDTPNGEGSTSNITESLNSITQKQDCLDISKHSRTDTGKGGETNISKTDVTEQQRQQVSRFVKDQTETIQTKKSATPNGDGSTNNNTESLHSTTQRQDCLDISKECRIDTDKGLETKIIKTDVRKQLEEEETNITNHGTNENRNTVSGEANRKEHQKDDSNCANYSESDGTTLDPTNSTDEQEIKALCRKDSAGNRNNHVQEHGTPILAGNSNETRKQKVPPSRKRLTRSTKKRRRTLSLEEIAKDRRKFITN